MLPPHRVWVTEARDNTVLLYCVVQFELGNEADVARLKKLFEVTQAVMQVKGTQAMIAEEELAKLAAQQGKSTAKRGIVVVTSRLPLYMVGLNQPILPPSR